MSTRRPPHPIRLAAGVLGIVWFTGCAGYQLGPTMGRESGAVSIQVNPFLNQTPEPRLSDDVTFALRKRLQQDGTYRLNTRNEGDIIVTGTLLKYERDALSYDADDVISPRDFRLTVTAQIKAVERDSGRVLLDRTLTGRSTARLLSDLPNTERQALPLVAEDLARRAAALLVDGEW